MNAVALAINAMKLDHSQSEFERLYLVVRRDLHIRRFQITMNDAFFVCSLQCFADAPRDVESFFDGNPYRVRCDPPAFRRRQVRGRDNADRSPLVDRKWQRY